MIDSTQKEAKGNINKEKKERRTVCFGETKQNKWFSVFSG